MDYFYVLTITKSKWYHKLIKFYYFESDFIFKKGYFSRYLHLSAYSSVWEVLFKRRIHLICIKLTFRHDSEVLKNDYLRNWQGLKTKLFQSSMIFFTLNWIVEHLFYWNSISLCLYFLIHSVIVLWKVFRDINAENYFGRCHFFYKTYFKCVLYVQQ